MSLIKSKGYPTRYTRAAVGDYYIDVETGKKYKCTFAYQDVTGTLQCDWIFVGVEESKQESVVIENNISEEPVTKTETAKSSVNNSNNKYNNNKRKNYHKQYNNNK